MSESLITDLSRAFHSKDGASLPSPGSGRERGPPQAQPGSGGAWQPWRRRLLGQGGLEMGQVPKSTSIRRGRL